MFLDVYIFVCESVLCVYVWYVFMFVYVYVCLCMCRDVYGMYDMCVFCIYNVCVYVL